MPNPPPGPNRATQYASSSSKQDRINAEEKRVEKLKRDLRDHIRNLADFPVLSADWMRMAESLHQIAKVAGMDIVHLDARKNPLKQVGKMEGGTLWDMQKDQIAIRIILEEGKLNLILRIMHGYRVQRRSNTWGSLVKNVSLSFSTDSADVDARCLLFENSISVLLDYACDHVEALQILDIPELITHCKELLQDSAEMDEEIANVDKIQESFMFSYLAKLTGAMEHTDEDRMLDLFVYNHILLSMTEELTSHYLRYSATTLKNACLVLSNIFGSENFLTNPDRFCENKRLKNDIVSLKGFFVMELTNKYDLPKRKIRPLLDLFRRWERLPYITKPAILPYTDPRESSNNKIAHSDIPDVKTVK